MTFDSTEPIDVMGRLGRFSKVGAGSLSVKTSQGGQYLDCVNAGINSAYPLGLTYWSDTDWPRYYLTCVIVAIQTVAANNSSEAAKAPFLMDTTGYYEGNWGISMGNTYGTATGWFGYAPTGGAPVTQNYFVNGAPMVGGTPGHVETNKIYCVGIRATNYFNNGYVRFGAKRDNNYFMQGGGPLLCYVLAGHLSDGEMSALTLNPTEPLLFPEDLVFGWPSAAATGTTVSLTGIALTSSAGSVEEALAVAATGSAATSAAGTPTSAIASALAGSAGTASAGTATSGIGMSLTGEALTVSAGSLAYSIGFTLTGSAATSAGGTLTSSGGDVLTSRSLTGISMTALPGNVRVTGGTRWRPSEAQAVTPPSMVGNTLQPPPRLVGDPASDNRAIQQWLQTLYDHVIKRDNVLGRIADHETRIAAIEATDDTGST